jgi:hypothetical protein
LRPSCTARAVPTLPVIPAKAGIHPHPQLRPTIPLAANIWRVKNIANMLYFAQMVIFYQL